jgi:hypothetical protein
MHSVILLRMITFDEDSVRIPLVCCYSGGKPVNIKATRMLRKLEADGLGMVTNRLQIPH